MTATTTVAHQCPRCDGLGVIEVYRRVNGGVCLLCAGSGRRPGKAHNPRPREAAKGANERLWQRFAAAHPVEAAVIWAGKDTDPKLGRAYAEVTPFRERDYNPQAALALYHRMVS